MASPYKPEDGTHELASLHSIGSRLKFRQLKLLLAIEDLGSVHQAARMLHMSQPGASKALKEIEEALGLSLFARSAQGLMATDMGRCVIRHARLIYASLSHMHEELEDISRGGGRRIAVGTIPGGLARLLVDALLQFRALHPFVNVELYEDTSVRLLEQLQSGAIDVALCRTSVSAHPSLFHFEWLQEEQVGVVVSPQHPLARKSEVTWQDTAEYPWVLFPSHTPLRTLLEREAANQNIVVSRSHIEASSTFATALLLSKSDTLIALLTQESINFFETTKVLKALPIRFTASAEPYGIVTRAGPVNNPNVAKLCECLRWTRQRQLEAS